MTDFVKYASKIAQDYYPEIMGKMLVINAPMTFTAIWAIIKGWLDEKTRRKISIFGGGYMKELLKFVNDD